MAESSQAQAPRWVGVTTTGCLILVTAVGGYFGGGMIAVLVAKLVGALRGCEPPEGVPACGWENYAVVGCVIGVVLLPTVTLLRLRQSARRDAVEASASPAATHSERG